MSEYRVWSCVKIQDMRKLSSRSSSQLNECDLADSVRKTAKLVAMDDISKTAYDTYMTKLGLTPDKKKNFAGVMPALLSTFLKQMKVGTVFRFTSKSSKYAAVVPTSLCLCLSIWSGPKQVASSGCIPAVDYSCKASSEWHITSMACKQLTASKCSMGDLALSHSVRIC